MLQYNTIKKGLLNNLIIFYQEETMSEAKVNLLINSKHVITAYWDENKKYAIYEYYKDCNYNYDLNNEKVKVYADKVVTCNCWRNKTCEQLEKENGDDFHCVETKETETNITKQNYLSFPMIKKHVKSAMFDVKRVSVITATEAI